MKFLAFFALIAYASAFYIGDEITIAAQGDDGVSTMLTNVENSFSPVEVGEDDQFVFTFTKSNDAGLNLANQAATAPAFIVTNDVLSNENFETLVTKGSNALHFPISLQAIAIVARFDDADVATADEELVVSDRLLADIFVTGTVTTWNAAAVRDTDNFGGKTYNTEYANVNVAITPTFASRYESLSYSFSSFLCSVPDANDFRYVGDVVPSRDVDDWANNAVEVVDDDDIATALEDLEEGGVIPVWYSDWIAFEAVTADVEDSYIVATVFNWNDGDDIRVTRTSDITAAAADLIAEYPESLDNTVGGADWSGYSLVYRVDNTQDDDDLIVAEGPFAGEDQFRTPFINTRGGQDTDAYPLSVYQFLVLPADLDMVFEEENDAVVMAAFIFHILSNTAQASISSLGYAPLDSVSATTSANNLNNLQFDGESFFELEDLQAE